MKRTTLLEKLSIVAPALAANDIVPINSHIWFTGRTLMAYNGHIAISTPCETTFKCAVPGSTFLNLMKAAKAKEIEFELRDGTLHGAGAAMKLKMPTLPAETFNFKMPKAPESTLSVKASELVKGIETCLRSVSLDTTTPDYLGVTLLPRPYGVDFFGACGLTMSRAVVKFNGGVVPKWNRAIMPNAFCKQLPVLAKDAKKVRFSLTDERVMFAGEDGTVMFGALVDTEKPLPFLKVFEQHLPPDRTMYPIASKLIGILDRACVITTGEASVIRTKIEVKDGTMNFTTVSRFGEVHDRMMVLKGQQPDVTLEIDAKPARAACADFKKMLITNNCLVMANDAAYFMISGRDN